MKCPACGKIIISGISYKVGIDDFIIIEVLCGSCGKRFSAQIQPEDLNPKPNDGK